MYHRQIEYALREIGSCLWSLLSSLGVCLRLGGHVFNLEGYVFALGDMSSSWGMCLYLGGYAFVLGEMSSSWGICLWYWQYIWLTADLTWWSYLMILLDDLSWWSVLMLWLFDGLLWWCDWWLVWYSWWRTDDLTWLTDWSNWPTSLLISLNRTILTFWPKLPHRVGIVSWIVAEPASANPKVSIIAPAIDSLLWESLPWRKTGSWRPDQTKNYPWLLWGAALGKLGQWGVCPCVPFPSNGDHHIEKR